MSVFTSSRRKQKLQLRDTGETGDHREVDVMDMCSQSSSSATSSQGDSSSQESLTQSSSQSSTGSSSSAVRRRGVSSNGVKLGRPIGRTSSYQRRDAARSEEDYETQRLKNNEAVRKSREKQKKHLSDTLDLISRMEESNSKLEVNVDHLKKELILIRLMYSAHVKKAHGWTLHDDQMICDQDEKARQALADKEAKEKPKMPSQVTGK